MCHATITHPLEWVEPQYNMPRVIKQLSDASISLPRNVGPGCGFQPHFLQLHAYLGSPQYYRYSNISGLTSFHGMYLATFPSSYRIAQERDEREMKSTPHPPSGQSLDIENPPPNHHKPILYSSHPDQEITGRITVACDSDLCCPLNTCIGIPAALGGPRYTRNIKARADSAVCKIHTTPRVSCFLVAHSETGAATRHKYLEIGRSVSRRSKSCLQAQIILQDILPTSPSLRERRRRKA